MKKYEIGLIGLSVMGENLTLNISRNHSIAVYNRTTSKTEDFINNKVKQQDIKGTYKLEEFISSLAKPRKIMLMIKAGKPVDLVIDSLLPYLEEDDIIIDGGNSHFKDTDRRLKNLSENKLSIIKKKIISAFQENGFNLINVIITSEEKLEEWYNDQ